jgi:hypothetical protein
MSPRPPRQPPLPSLRSPHAPTTQRGSSSRTIRHRRGKFYAALTKMAY